MAEHPAFLVFMDSALARWRRHRREVRTRRAIAELPHHMRKDIGWPDALPDRPARQTLYR